MPVLEIDEDQSTADALWARCVAAQASGQTALTDDPDGTSDSVASSPGVVAPIVDDVMSFASFGATLTRRYAGALPNGLTREPGAELRASLFEVLDWPALPRFLSGQPPDDISTRSPDGISCYESKPDKPPFRRPFGFLTPAIDVESAAYAAAFAGLGFAGLACIAVMFSQPSALFRGKVADPIPQIETTAPIVKADAAPVKTAPPVAPAQPPQAESATSDQTLGETEARLSFAQSFVGSDALFVAPVAAAPVRMFNPALLNEIATEQSSQPELAGDPAMAGIVMIKNLPPEASLSSGERVSQTDWKLSPAELNGLVVTIPAPPQKPVATEIEIFNREGRSEVTTRIEFRLLADAVALPPVAVNRKVKRRQAKKTAAAPLANANAETSAEAPEPLAAAPQVKPLKTAYKTPAAAAPAPALTIPSLFKWLSPEEAAKPQSGYTSNEEFLMNFGAMPRD